MYSAPVQAALVVPAAKVRRPSVVPAGRCLPKVANRLRPAPAKGRWALADPVALVRVVPVSALALAEDLAPVPADPVLNRVVHLKADPSAGRTADLRDSARIGRSSNGKIPRCTPY